MIDNISICLDKMIKHEAIFTLSKPVPSEADIITKIWANLLRSFSLILESIFDGELYMKFMSMNKISLIYER